MNPDVYSSTAQQVLEEAGREARALNHEYIGTEHLLLAVIHDDGVMERLEGLGVSADDIRSGTERAVRRGRDAVPAGRLPFTTRAQNVLEFAAEDARKVGAVEVGPDHILRGLLRETKGIACEILNLLGVRLENIG